jgi:hypothetical protein
MEFVEAINNILEAFESFQPDDVKKYKLIELIGSADRPGVLLGPRSVWVLKDKLSDLNAAAAWFKAFEDIWDPTPGKSYARFWANTMARGFSLGHDLAAIARDPTAAEDCIAIREALVKFASLSRTARWPADKRDIMMYIGQPAQLIRDVAQIETAEIPLSKRQERLAAEKSGIEQASQFINSGFKIVLEHPIIVGKSASAIIPPYKAGDRNKENTIYWIIELSEPEALAYWTRAETSGDTTWCTKHLYDEVHDKESFEKYKQYLNYTYPAWHPKSGQTRRLVAFTAGDESLGYPLVAAHYLSTGSGPLYLICRKNLVNNPDVASGYRLLLIANREYKSKDNYQMRRVSCTFDMALADWRRSHGPSSIIGSLREMCHDYEGRL